MPRVDAVHVPPPPFPVLAPAVLRPVARRLAEGNAWARNVVVAAPLVTWWLISVQQRVLWAVVPCGVLVPALALKLPRPRGEPAFTFPDPPTAARRSRTAPH